MINDKYKKKYLKYKKKYLKYKKNKIHIGGAEEDCKLISITLHVIPQWIVGTTTEEIKMIVNLDDPLYTSISKKIDDILKKRGIYKRYDFDSYYKKISHLNRPYYAVIPKFHVEKKNITVKLGEIELPENENATFEDYNIVEGHELTVVLKQAFMKYPGMFDEEVEKRLKAIEMYEALENREIKRIEDLSEEDKKRICIEIFEERLASEEKAAIGVSGSGGAEYQCAIDNLKKKIHKLKKELENTKYEEKKNELRDIFRSIEVIPKVQEKALDVCYRELFNVN